MLVRLLLSCLHLSLAPFLACFVPALRQVPTTTSTKRPCLHLRSRLPCALPAATVARRPARTTACPAPCSSSLPSALAGSALDSSPALPSSAVPLAAASPSPDASPEGTHRDTADEAEPASPEDTPPASDAEAEPAPTSPNPPRLHPQPVCFPRLQRDALTPPARRPRPPVCLPRLRRDALPPRRARGPVALASLAGFLRAQPATLPLATAAASICQDQHIGARPAAAAGPPVQLAHEHPPFLRATARQTGPALVALRTSHPACQHLARVSSPTARAWLAPSTSQAHGPSCSTASPTCRPPPTACPPYPSQPRRACRGPVHLPRRPPACHARAGQSWTCPPAGASPAHPGHHNHHQSSRRQPALRLRSHIHWPSSSMRRCQRAVAWDPRLACTDQPHSPNPARPDPHHPQQIPALRRGLP